MRRAPIRPVSAKRRAEQQVRRDLASPYEHERCWIGLPGCTGWAEAWHELVSAAQGGSRTDTRNLCASCDMCNASIETLADRYALGLKVAREDATEGCEGLVPAEPHPLSLAQRWT